MLPLHEIFAKGSIRPDAAQIPSLTEGNHSSDTSSLGAIKDKDFSDRLKQLKADEKPLRSVPVSKTNRTERATEDRSVTEPSRTQSDREALKSKKDHLAGSSSSKTISNRNGAVRYSEDIATADVQKELPQPDPKPEVHQQNQEETTPVDFQSDQQSVPTPPPSLIEATQSKPVRPQESFDAEEESVDAETLPFLPIPASLQQAFQSEKSANPKTKNSSVGSESVENISDQNLEVSTVNDQVILPFEAALPDSPESDSEVPGALIPNDFIVEESNESQEVAPLSTQEEIPQQSQGNAAANDNDLPQSKPVVDQQQVPNNEINANSQDDQVENFESLSDSSTQEVSTDSITVSSTEESEQVAGQVEVNQNQSEVSSVAPEVDSGSLAKRPQAPRDNRVDQPEQVPVAAELSEDTITFSTSDEVEPASDQVESNLEDSENSEVAPEADAEGQDYASQVPAAYRVDQPGQTPLALNPSKDSMEAKKTSDKPGAPELEKTTPTNSNLRFEASINRSANSPAESFDPKGTLLKNDSRIENNSTRAESQRPVLDTTKADVPKRLAGYLQQAAEQGRAMKVRLHPPELGTLQIEVSRLDGQLTARLEVESATVRALLFEQISLLRESLNQQGLRVDQLFVEVNENLGSDEEQQSSQEQDQESPSGNSSESNQQQEHQDSDSESSEDHPASIPMTTKVGIQEIDVAA